ncbi:hypothetical protein SPBR_02106 [Sporothrix brasiliensis 5110]|uniref:Uncharacterized protein n=1 Tax=Sporothrix brasiliensis 5110 TaxID=1398154 RepID=A0A0C2IWW4_9PEZI|nr:uncharacterized protein SPBR_02106 [Sporothrix brasiliensis 5110]KIH91240.1 hypothetical protein SPBR_02106 [Sporothrix brasiliensis 5110]
MARAPKTALPLSGATDARDTPESVDSPHSLTLTATAAAAASAASHMAITDALVQAYLAMVVNDERTGGRSWPTRAIPAQSQTQAHHQPQPQPQEQQELQQVKEVAEPGVETSTAASTSTRTNTRTSDRTGFVKRNGAARKFTANL